MIRRSLILLAVADYLLAVTVGGWFHDHGHQGCLPQHDAAATHGDCAGAAGRQHAEDEGETSTCEARHPCQICRFLAQKPIPSITIGTVESAPLAEELAAARPVRHPASVPSSRQIRAPPRVA